ncbi:MAG: YkgJ family cysteine cluster protein [Candidatus Korobacteraceae bacterium]
MRVPLPHGDQQLVQIIDTALADTARRSGEWLVCKPGCTQCCMGAFAINQLDAARLQDGLAELEASDPARAAQVRERARASIARISHDFPGDPDTGVLNEGKAAEALFEEFANDEPCPVLDPQTGMCDLYAARPMTCRVFGPPVQSEGGLGVCELCYHGASEAEIAACEMTVDPEGIELALLDELEGNTRRWGRTIVAFAVGL